MKNFMISHLQSKNNKWSKKQRKIVVGEILSIQNNFVLINQTSDNRFCKNALRR